MSLPRKRRGPPRRTIGPRCMRQRCNQRAELYEMCVKHAEQEADRLFSLWIRARDQHCTGRVLEPPCKGVLQAAHNVGRGNHTTRYDVLNVHALCERHHKMVDQHGREGLKRAWVIDRIGEAAYAALMERSRAFTARRESVDSAMAWLVAA